MQDATSVCSVEGCDNTYPTPTRLRPNTPGPGTLGICTVHFKRVRSTGDVHKAHCQCKCGQLVDLHGDNVTLKTFITGHREAAAQARKRARAEAVLQLCEWSAEPPDITKQEATDLNWLLVQTGRRRCGRCKQIKPLTDFAKIMSPDSRKTGQSAERLAHLRADRGTGFGYTSCCTPCSGERVKNWHKNNQKRYSSTCAVCGEEFSGSRKEMKCCSPQCSGRYGGEAKAQLTNRRQRVCARPDCDTGFFRTSTDAHKGKWCSEQCYTIVMDRAQQPGLFRQAVEAWDYPALLAELQKRVTVTEPLGCWNWNGRMSRAKNGGGQYAEANFGKRRVPVHRAVLEIKHGKPLGSQAAHHTCGNSECVNPDHLQPISHRENMAEMLTRKTLTNRIRDLEDVVRALAPDHPILNVIDVL